MAEWKKHRSVSDLPTGPKQPRSTVLSVEDEAAIIAFRRHTLLSLDDCLYALQPTLPHLTRSSLHRCLQRHGISRLPAEVGGDKSAKKRFKSSPIGSLHIDITDVQTADGKLYLFVVIDRTSKFAFTEMHAKAGKMQAAQFLRNLINAVPYILHKVLTNNGIQFTSRACDRYALDQIFQVCIENGIEHRLIKIKNSWTKGQVERMNRTLKEATVKRFHYDDHVQLQKHLAHFIDAYNFGRRLKTLKGLTPYEYICRQWATELQRFRIDPIHQMPGLYT